MLKMQNMFLLLLGCNMLLAVYATDNKKQQQNQEIWEQDLSDTFKIEGSDQGIQKVNLKCGANSMNVMLETEKPFTGVMYTRGSFYKQTAPCFMKPNDNQGTRTLEMNFQLDQCQTLKDGELYSNIVVIQNDPELITPGDSAFRWNVISVSPAAWMWRPACKPGTELHKSCAEHAVEPASVNRTLHYDYPLSSSTLLTSNSCT